jgi:hypothetical protein
MELGWRRLCCERRSSPGVWRPFTAAAADRAFDRILDYLPRVYPTDLRGTGESFAANVGGRMIGTSAALLTTVARTVADLENAEAVTYDHVAEAVQYRG